MDIQKLTRLQFKGAVIGMVLGDGSLTNRKSSSLIIYSVIEDYIKMKQNILSQLTKTSIFKQTDRSNSYGKKPLYIVSTLSHPIYTKLRMRMYHNNRKTIDKYVMKTMNELGLLLWYLDDGSLNTHENRIQFRIESNGFNLIEHQYIQKVLNDKFDLRFNVQKYFRKSKAKIYYRLYLKAIDRLRFYDNIINPFLKYIPSEIMYKIPKREDIEKAMNSKKHRRFYENIV